MSHITYDEKKYESYKENLMKPTIVIGRDDKAVENGNFIAKQQKGKTLYNILVAEGGELGKPKISEKAAIYNKLEASLLEINLSNPPEFNKINEAYELIEKLKTDSNTGLPTKSGAHSKIEKNRSSKYAVIFIDLDDMHYWNEKEGYQNVDKRLNAVGRGIKKTVRKELEQVVYSAFRTKQRRKYLNQDSKDCLNKRHSKTDRRSQSKGEYDIVQKIIKETVACRVNEDAGDEFKVYIPVEDFGKETIEILKKIAKRLADNIYNKQIELLEKAKSQGMKPKFNNQESYPN